MQWYNTIPLLKSVKSLSKSQVSLKSQLVVKEKAEGVQSLKDPTHSKNSTAHTLLFRPFLIPGCPLLTVHCLLSVLSPISPAPFPLPF